MTKLDNLFLENRTIIVGNDGHLEQLKQSKTSAS